MQRQESRPPALLGLPLLAAVTAWAALPRRPAVPFSDRKLMSLRKALVRHKSWTSANVEQKPSFLRRAADGAHFYRMLGLELALSLRVLTTTPHRG